MDGAPEPWLNGAPLPATVSISHRAGVALAAVSGSGATLGCDLEVVEPRSDAFMRDYFTDGERALLEAVEPRERVLRAVLVWSAKEAALKALRTGLRRDTRSVAVSWPEAERASDGWRTVVVRDAATGRVFAGHWRTSGAHLATIVTGSPVADPPPLVALSS